MLVGIALVGCGAAGGGGHTLHAWRPQPPYLPPPAVAAAPKVHVAAPRLAAVRGPMARAADVVASGAPSDAQIRRELVQAFGAGDAVDRAALSSDGLATVPTSAPSRVEAIIRAANSVARLPYVYGGGHATWEDGAYDCSGSVSFALAAAGLLNGPLDSTSFMSWGDAGPGRWVTIYANGGHAWMVVAGLRFDTSGLRIDGSRWTAQTRSTAGFVLRHPVGL